MATSLGELFVVLRAKTDQFKKDLAGATATLKKHQAGLAGVSVASGALAAGLTAAGAKLAKVAGEFEFSITRVGALANAMPKNGKKISKEFEALKKAARIMGEQTEFSAKQSADGMQFLAMAGFDAKQIIQAMPSVLQLATAGATDLATAANITSNIVAAMGMEISELAATNDVLVNAFTNTNTSLSSLGESFKFVGPVAKGAGVDFKELTAAIGILGNMGIQGSMAGTTMRNAIVRLIKPTGEAKDVIKQLGLNSAISNGKITSLTDIIRILEEKGASTADIMTVFGIRAGPGMAALVEAGAGSLDRLVSKLHRTGTAAEIQAALLNTTKGQMTILKSAVESLQISLGNALLPTLRSVVSIFQDIVGRFNNLSPSTKELVVKIGMAVAAFSAVLAALTGLAAVIPFIVTGFGAMAAAAGVIAAPLAVVVAGLLGIIFQVGLLKKIWSNDLFAIRTVTLNVIKLMTKAFDIFTKSVKGNLLSIAKIMDALADPLGAVRGKKGALTTAAEDLLTGKGLKDAAGAAGDLIAKPIEMVGIAIKDNFMEGLGVFGDLLDKALPRGMKNGMGKALAELTKGLGGGKGFFKPARVSRGAAAGGIDFEEDDMFGRGIAQQIADDMKFIGDLFKKGAEDLRKGFPKFVKELDRADLAFGRSRISDIADSRRKKEAFAIKQAAAATFDMDADVRAAVGNLRSSFANIGRAVRSLGNAGLELVSRMGEGGGVISNVIQGFKQGGIFGGIATLAVEILSRSKSFKEISETLSEIIADLAESFGWILDIVKPLVKAIGKLVAGFRWVIGKIGEGLKKLFSKTKKVFGNIMDRVRESIGVEEEKGGPTRQFEDMTQREQMRVNTALRQFHKLMALTPGVMQEFHKNMAASLEVKWWEDPAFAPFKDDSPWASITDQIMADLENASSDADIGEIRQGLQEWMNEMQLRISNALAMGAISSQEADDAWAQVLETFQGLTDSVNMASTDLDEMGETVKSVNEQLTNVPEGFKVALARFRSTEADAFGGIGVGSVDDARKQTPGATTTIEQLNVFTDDPRQFAQDFQDETNWQNFVNTGSENGDTTVSGGSQNVEPE